MHDIFVYAISRLSCLNSNCHLKSMHCNCIGIMFAKYLFVKSTINILSSASVYT